MSCELYENLSFWPTVVSLNFAIAIFLSYTPQQITIMRNKSIEGINTFYLFLMNLGSSFSFFNMLILSRPVFACCKSELSFYECTGNLIGLMQLTGGLLGPVLILCTAINYKPKDYEGIKLMYWARILLAVDFIVWVLAISITSPLYSKLVAEWLGVMAIAVGTVQYVPQIMTTYKLKHAGSLSILMLCIQVPGALLWVLSLATRRDAQWSTWMPIVVSASFQSVLLLMAVKYTWQRNSEQATEILP